MINNLFNEIYTLHDRKDYLNKPINVICKKVCLFMNARDEKNIKEWVAHHLLLGFDKIIIFDHKSKNPIKDELNNFDNRVEVVNVSFLKLPIKIYLMKISAKIARNLNMDWMLYLDADEFLVLNNKYKGVKQLLSEFNHADALAINWLMFGSNNLEKEPDGLIIDNYTKSNLILNDHVKTFVRPNRIINIVNPHFYIISDKFRVIGINNKILLNNLHKNNTGLEYNQARAYIAHYVNQSEETFTKRKLNLPNDDQGKMRIFNENDIKNIHNQFNDIENFDVKNKYSEKIKLFLEKNQN